MSVIDDFVETFESHDDSDRWNVKDDGTNTVWILDAEIDNGPVGVKAHQLTNGNVSADEVRAIADTTGINYEMKTIKRETQHMFTLLP